MSCDLSREQIVAGGVASTGVTGWLFSRWSPQDELSRLKESAQLFPDWPTQRKARCVGHPSYRGEALNSAIRQSRSWPASAWSESANLRFHCPFSTWYRVIV